MNNKNNNLINYYLTKYAAQAKAPQPEPYQVTPTMLNSIKDRDPKEIENTFKSNANFYGNTFDDYQRAYANNSVLVQASHLPLWERFKATLYSLFGLKTDAIKAMESNLANDAKIRARGMQRTMAQRFDKKFGKGAFSRYHLSDPNSAQGRAYRAWLDDYKNKVNKRMQMMQQNNQNRLNAAGRGTGISGALNVAYINAVNNRFNQGWDDPRTGYQARKQAEYDRLMQTIKSRDASVSDLHRYTQAGYNTLNPAGKFVNNMVSWFGYDPVEDTIAANADDLKRLEGANSLVYGNKIS